MQTTEHKGEAARPRRGRRGFWRWLEGLCRAYSNTLSGVGALVGMLGLVSLIFAGCEFIHSAKESAEAAEFSARTEVYRAANDVTKVVHSRPGFRVFFYADDADTPEARQAALDKRLKELTAAEQEWLRFLVEFIADNFDQMFWLRKDLPAADWNAWWQYFQDTYDASATLRAFYKDRAAWYTVDEYLAEPAKRPKLVRTS